MPTRRHSYGVIALAILVVAVVALTAACRSSGGEHKPAAAVGTSDPFPAGPVSHEGRWLTDASGRVLLLHGVNMVAKDAPYYPAARGFGDDDAAWLADNGFDVVRLGVMATGLMPEPGKVDAAYLEHLAETVTVLARHHILTLFDFHQDGWGPSLGSDGFPEWMTLTNGAENTHTTFPLYYVTNPAIQAAFQSFWANQAGPGGVPLQAQFGAMAVALARRFADEPAVLGYDLINEPWPGTTWQPCALDAAGCPNLDRDALDGFYRLADEAIRGTGDKHLVFGEPFVLFNFGGGRTNIALPGGDQASGLSFHVYPLTPDRDAAVLANAIDWSAQTNGALIETEWGATDAPSEITRQADEFDQALMPWIYWSYDRFVHDLAAPPAGANLNAAAAGALVRPHPLAIAGTPERVNYDAATRTLNVAWSSTGLDGRSFPPGTVTSFEIPAAVYPSGYVVTALGATVTSAPNAPILTVTAAAGAQDSNVTVTPAP